MEAGAVGREARLCSPLAGFQLGRAVLLGQLAGLPDLPGKALTRGDTGLLGAGVCVFTGTLTSK